MIKPLALAVLGGEAPPQWGVPTAARTMSPNLRLNEQVAARRAAGEQIVPLAFGEARLPVFPPLVRVLRQSAGRSGYGPVAGSADARLAGAGYFSRRRLPTEGEQVVLGPGSKTLLLAINLVVPGDVLIPRPCWNSYAPQAVMAGKRAFGVPIPASCGGVPEPTALRQALRSARARRADPRILILTLPDNPTGTVAPPELVRELCGIAQEEELVIVSDEIYRDVVHNPETLVLSPAEVAPERTVVTTGLSKSLALGGWRIGLARLPAGPYGALLRDSLVAVASDAWSSLAGPMQAVAAYAFNEPPEIRHWLAVCARLHGLVARAVHRAVLSAGAVCRPPTAGFYVYPDLEPARGRLSARGITDSASLQRCLLEEFGLAVLAGHLLGDDRRALRFKAATSMLYGDTAEQQRQALFADDPLTLPHVLGPIARIAEGFHQLCR